VDFRYTDEQLALQETLQRWISRDYGFEQRRALSRSALGYSPEAWAHFADLGLLALPFPEEFGGLGGNHVDLMVVMEQVGQGLLLEPYWSTGVLCGGLIRDSGSKVLQQRLLPEIVAGRVKLALAAYEDAGRYELSHVECSATRRGGGWSLSGGKTTVLDLPSSDWVLVSARTAGRVTDTDGISVFLVKRDAPGLTVSEYQTQWGSRAGDLRLEAVTVSDADVVGEIGQGFAILERATDAGIAALCAESVGIVSALNQATLGYLKTRKQFGVPIGTFQALQHRMADMYIAAEQIRSMAIVAAVSADSQDFAERHRAIAGAKAYIGQAARFVGQQAVQLHGGMGIVDELIVSHYFKRLTMIDLTLGDADYHLARYSDTMVA
jgi:alkylation response protein AidB-like acyl-CoA dehydrogenase